MDVDEHARHLGGVLANLHTLEFLIRTYLSEQPGARSVGSACGADVYNSPVGTVVPESDITSYDSLNELMSKFNSDMKLKGKAELDLSLIDLRDAIAHGRVSALVADEHMRLVKFDRPRKGSVKVAYNEEMTEHWFTATKARLLAAISRVHSEVNR